MGVIFKQGSRFNVEDRVITVAEATNQELVLEKTPKDPEKVVLDFTSGTVQRYNFDYVVTGNVLSWAGYALETLIESGDAVKITYPL